MTKLQESAGRSDQGRDEQSMRQFANIERQIESGKKLAELVGKDATVLEVEAWVNGSPLTDAELEGQSGVARLLGGVVRSLHCHLPALAREWNEKYGEKGLVDCRPHPLLRT